MTHCHFLPSFHQSLKQSSSDKGPFFACAKDHCHIKREQTRKGTRNHGKATRTKRPACRREGKNPNLRLMTVNISMDPLSTWVRAGNWGRQKLNFTPFNPQKQRLQNVPLPLLLREGEAGGEIFFLSFYFKQFLIQRAALQIVWKFSQHLSQPHLLRQNLGA